MNERTNRFQARLAAQERKKVEGEQVEQDAAAAAPLTFDQLLGYYGIRRELIDRQINWFPDSLIPAGDENPEEIIKLLRWPHYTFSSIGEHFLVKALARVLRGDEQMARILSVVPQEEAEKRKAIDPREHDDYLRLVELGNDPFVEEALAAYHKKFALPDRRSVTRTVGTWLKRQETVWETIDVPFRIARHTSAKVVQQYVPSSRYVNEIDAVVELSVDLGIKYDDVIEQSHRQVIFVRYIWQGTNGMRTAFSSNDLRFGNIYPREVLSPGLNISYGLEDGSYYTPHDVFHEDNESATLEKFRQFLIDDFMREQPKVITAVSVRK